MNDFQKEVGTFWIRHPEKSAEALDTQTLLPNMDLSSLRL